MPGRNQTRRMDGPRTLIRIATPSFPAASGLPKGSFSNSLARYGHGLRTVSASSPPPPASQERLSERFIKNSMRLRVGRQMSYESAGETRLVSGAKLAPQGRLRKAQGASPGNKHSNKGSPEGAMQLVPVPKRLLMTSIYLELRTKSLRRPFRAFRNLALEPRACALGCPAGPLRGPWFRDRT